MTPKRKFIKKQYIAPETDQTQAGSYMAGDLIDQLKSEDQKIKTDAITVLANLQTLDNDYQEDIYSVSTLLELIKILATSTNNTLIQTALFAINNLCVNETESNPIEKTVKTLFKNGLDKALLQLNSSDVHLIKPILILMSNIADFIPSEHRYLLEGIQNTLVSGSQKYLKQQKYYDLVIEFLMKSKYIINLQQIIQPQQKCLQQLRIISEVDKMYRNRAMAAITLSIMTQGKNKECIDIFCTNFDEFITDIDLEKEYVTNFMHKEDQNQEEDQFIDEQQVRKQQERKESGMEQEDMKKKSKKGKKKNKNKEKQIQQIQQTKSKPQFETPYVIFIDALQGLQTMLEFIVEQFEDEENYEEEQDEEEMDEEQGNEKEIKGLHVFSKEIFLKEIQKVLVKDIQYFMKFSVLTFIEGQNLIQLTLRMFLALPKNFNTIGSQAIQAIITITQAIMIQQFKLQLKQPNRIPEQVLIFNFKTSLEVIRRYNQIINRGLYVELPQLKYPAVGNSQGEKVIKINGKWKECWINLLEIYSKFYDPEKNKFVTEAQNRSIGATLKQLLIQIPQIQLQQWRGQAIDTVFDIYSNENFDNVFMEYGFMQVLGHILKIAGNNKLSNLKGKKAKKRNQFINEVIQDLQRFMAYKKQKIGL